MLTYINRHMKKAAVSGVAVTGKNWFEVSNLLKIHILEAAGVQLQVVRQPDHQPFQCWI